MTATVRLDDIDDETMVASPQVREHFGSITRDTLQRWIKDPELAFPQPLQIRGRNYWRAADLKRWQRKRAQRIVRPARQKVAA